MNRTDDYASQLSALTLAAMSKDKSTDRETERDIVKALFTPQKIREDSQVDADREERLWNSRLVMAIADILDRDQEEIARGLAQLEDEESELFQSLHGDDSPEDDTPFAELTQLEKNLGSADSRTARKRTKAWSTILKECKTDDFELLLAANQDGANIILEKYEAANDVQPIKLTDLELPGLIGWNNEEGLQAVSTFIEKESELLSQLSQAFRALSESESLTDEIVNRSQFPLIAQQWKAALETSFPKKQLGRNILTSYILPGFPGASLLGLAPVHTKLCNGILIVME